MALWIVGLVTLVPYGTYYLFFEASRDQYAFLATAVLFWIFGYWGVVGPVVAARKARAVLRAMEGARSRNDLFGTLRSPDARESAIDLIASENGLPRFVAARVYALLVRALAKATEIGHGSGRAS